MFKPSGVSRHANIFEHLLALPTWDELNALGNTFHQVSIRVSRLDGLLASCFTSPGPRLVSVADLLGKQSLDVTSIEAGLTKAQSVVERIIRFLQRNLRDSNDILAVLRVDYAIQHPILPQLGVRRKGDIGITMMLDPGLSYATRRPISDGLVTDKTNIALYQPRLGTVLTLIGAMHFLRAQRVAGKYVNVYIPLATSITLEPETTLPLLPGTDVAADHALVRQWLSSYQFGLPDGAHWSGLAYHTLQTQGAQQSISLDRGCLDLVWLAKLEQRVGRTLLDRWKGMLRSTPGRRAFDPDVLITSLLQRCSASWVAHLRDVALRNCHRPDLDTLVYTLHEAQEISCMMIPAPPQPLSTVLEQKEGTLRFGHALRLLGRANPSALRDVIDALDTVQSQDDLFGVLAQALQACVLAEAKSPFIIVPNDHDFAALLRDCEQYGAHTIAGLLIVLAMLRYPALATQRSEAKQPDGAEQLPTDQAIV